MKILVFIKVVPDTETRFQILPDGSDVVLDDGVEWIIDPYDENALEEAIRTKEKLGGSVTIITIGSGREQQVLRKALAMGADDAIWINDEDLAASDVMGIAKILAEEVKKLSPDLILCGREATDSSDSFVGVAVGEMLDIATVSDVNHLDAADDKLVATRDAPGRKERFEVHLPALLTIDWGINEPRYPKLPDIMKAKRKPLDQRSPDEYRAFAGKSNAVVSQTKVEFPPGREAGVVFEGEVDEMVEKLMDALVNKEKVIS